MSSPKLMSVLGAIGVTGLPTAPAAREFGGSRMGLRCAGPCTGLAEKNILLPMAT